MVAWWKNKKNEEEAEWDENNKKRKTGRKRSERDAGWFAKRGVKKKGGTMRARLVNKEYKKNGSTDEGARGPSSYRKEWRSEGGRRPKRGVKWSKKLPIPCMRKTRKTSLATTTTTTPSAANRSDEIYRRKTTSVLPTNSTSLRFNYAFLPGRVIDKVDARETLLPRY